ncbi:hypothetical protein ACTFIW_006846 [Dictyostelium discoideum]
MIKTILIKLILIVIFCYHFLFAEEDVISTPPRYYDLIRHKRDSPITEYQSSQDTDLYYPDVCRNALRPLDYPWVNQFAPFIFPGFIQGGFNSIFIPKNTSMNFKTAFHDSGVILHVVCIEGTFIVEGDRFLFANTIIVLPGGRFESTAGIEFYDENDSGVSYYPDLPKDPSGFFPGILVLGGSISVVGKEPIVYRATRINDSSIEISPPVPEIITSPNPWDRVYKLVKIFTELYPLGFYCRYNTDSIGKILSLSSYLLYPFPPVSENDKIIRVLVEIDIEQSVIPTNIYKRRLATKGSIYITGESNAYFKNVFFKNLGFTKNEPYNDTKLIFSPNDTNIVTDIIMGTNQKFRSSLYIESSKNVTIEGCAFVEDDLTRSPLVFFDSNVKISNSLISSKSGSNIIALHGTDSIQSSNNSYLLEKIDLASWDVERNNNIDCGNQGNGIYSISPNIISNGDSFSGQQTVFNYYFISNNSGNSNQANSSLLNPKPIEIIIKDSMFYPTASNGSLNKYFLNINTDGNKTISTYFTVRDLKTSHAINVNLNNSAIAFYNLKGGEGFKMEGSVERLDIIGSIINSNGALKNISTLTTNIIDSYIYSSSSDIEPFNNQIYGSLITPYYYSDSNTLDKFVIKSILPNAPIQIVSGSLFNVIVQIQTLSSSVSNDNISCIFTSSLINTTVVQVNSNYSCILPLNITNQEGPFNLRVTLINNTSPSSVSSGNYLYIIDFPEITVFNTYEFYSGWLMDNLNSSQQISFGGNSFKNGCNKVDSNCTISQNSKYSTGLPNVANQTEFDELVQLDQLFSNGITSTNPNEKVIISTKINSKIHYYQIQLFFTHIPIDDHPTPLSIYIENQAVFLLEPIKSIFPTFNNFTFKFQNKNSLDEINIAFTTRGDIYLTSMATYSSIEVEPPIETPTLSPTETPTETPTQSPTETPTLSPTETPTLSPTETPTLSPTQSPN